MTRVAISVEGQTEDEFCKKVLAPFLEQKGVEITPVIITTKRCSSGIKHKGGCVSLARIKEEISKLLPSFDYVTTFYDLYGFKITGSFTAKDLEQKIYDLFTSHKLIPYIQQYEFETLVFSKPSYFSEYFESSDPEEKIKTIIKECGGVENINNSTETAPSKRIAEIFQAQKELYDKVFHGPEIIEEVGLEAIMAECPRFKAWIEKIQNLK